MKQDVHFYHTVYLCVSYGYRNKKQVLPYIAFTDFS